MALRIYMVVNARAKGLCILSLVALEDRECSTTHHASQSTSCKGGRKRASNLSPKQKRHDASSE